MSAEQQFFERKIRTLFSRFDLDSNGSIEESDFDKWAENLVALGNLNAEQSDNLRRNIKQVWNVYFAPADVNGDGHVSVDELIAHIRLALADEAKRVALRDTLPLVYDAIDSNKDESVSKNEFANYFKSLNIVDSAVAEQVFNAVDTNGDGALSKAEFSAVGRDFFLSADESSPSRLFFGPLAD